ncbi:MAG: hypothetical protein AB7E34_10580 [Acidaminococcaceae bacterium]
MAKKKAAVRVADDTPQKTTQAPDEAKAPEAEVGNTQAPDEAKAPEAENTQAPDEAKASEADTKTELEKQAEKLMQDLGIKEIYRCPKKGYWFTRRDYASEHEKKVKSSVQTFNL